MNGLDYVVLVGALLGIAIYGTWRTRGSASLNTYLKGSGNTSWVVIGLSVMATQASATTFLSVPGQGYQDGMTFVQNYFGAPFALILICAVFLPIYRRLKVYTAYEYLGQRFDTKTRLLGTSLFLLQRGLGAGITIYAPAIVLSTVFNWHLDLTIILTGALVILYTVAGGNDAVNVTQKYQLGIIFAGMFIAMGVLLTHLPREITLSDAMRVAGHSARLNATDFSTSVRPRYTFWSGLIGGSFLAMSYFGTDQSQVQRYISGASLRESRLGLMFNAVLKIPMQFFILLLGVLLYVFYQFNPAPVYFNRTAWLAHEARGTAQQQKTVESAFTALHDVQRQRWLDWIASRNTPGRKTASDTLQAAQSQVAAARTEAVHLLDDDKTKGNEGDYIFIRFILDYLPHGVIGLLVAAFFAAAMSSKAAELTALGSTTTIDLYKHMIRTDASDAHYLAATRWFTVMWGIVAIGFALFARLAENLIQAGNIVGSLFYGPMLGLFLCAFFIRFVKGAAIFTATLASQIMVLALYSIGQHYGNPVSYLWFNVIGCGLCMGMAVLMQVTFGLAGAEEAQAS